MAVTGLHIVAKRWFQRTYGNTYHSVRISMDGKELVYLPFNYGYGEGWLQTAWTWLHEHGYAPKEYGGTRGLREDMGGSYEIHDVERKKEL